MHTRSGSALVITLGLLAVLGLLVFGYVYSARTERFAARHARDRVTARQFVDLAHDTGAWGVKVRPNAFPREVPRETTIRNIGAGLRELGEYAQGRGVEIWLEVHGRGTSEPAGCAAMMKAIKVMQTITPKANPTLNMGR